MAREAFHTFSELFVGVSQVAAGGLVFFDATSSLWRAGDADAPHPLLALLLMALGAWVVVRAVLRMVRYF